MNSTAISVFLLCFGLVTVLGFVAARWRSGDLAHLDEWGLGGRRFGTLVTWFLLGGDLYTAYTFVAVPALVFGAGALGFFAVPYSSLIYVFGFMVFPKLWRLSKRHGYVMLADMKEWPAFNEVYRTYFSPGKYPARSAFGTAGLALNARVEVECVAAK